MKKTKTRRRQLDPDRDTMRAEYDFSKAERGVTALRYAHGTNIIVLAPDVAARFPTAQAVNDALRSLAAVADRAQRKPRPIDRAVTLPAGDTGPRAGQPLGVRSARWGPEA